MEQYIYENARVESAAIYPGADQSVSGKIAK
jgi:hypothetical protein